MKFPPYWTDSDEIQKLLRDVDVLREAYNLHPIPQSTALHLARQSLLKSSLFSARIEGNPLNMTEAKKIDLQNAKERHTIEVSNIYQALTYIRNQKPKNVSVDLLKSLHAIILHGLSSETGYLRSEESAIYNEAGIAVYLTPGPTQIYNLLTVFCDYCNTSSDPTPIKAAASHVWFEKIHPFLDGNGRVGRAITNWILAQNNYDFDGIVPLEEYLDNHRQEYYQALHYDRQDVSPFIIFSLRALTEQARQTLKEALNPPTISYSNLLPRRAEIVTIITDHKMVSFDFLARRFRAVPTRTLHNDLMQLIKFGYIKKLGSTRGAIYTVGENTPAD